MTSVNAVQPIADYAKRVAKSGILGHVLWFRVPDLRIVPGQIHSEAIGAGMSTDKLPKLCHPADAFRKATTCGRSKDKSTKARIYVRPIVDDSREIVRAVVVERVVRSAHKLEHESTVYRLEFNKATAQMTCSPSSTFSNLSTTEQNAVNELVTGCRDRFNDLRQLLDGPTVTRWVMARLNELSKVSVHPNGHVYFVPHANVATLEKLSAFVKAMGKYLKSSEESVLFADVPLPDTSDHRAVVEEGFKRSIITEADQLVAEVSERLDRQMRTKENTVQGKVDEVASMRRKVAEYQKLLGIEASDLEIRLTQLDEQLDELLNRAARESSKKRRRR